MKPKRFHLDGDHNGRKISNQKFWQPKSFRLLLSLSLLAWATWGPTPASADASMPAGAWQAPNAATHPVPAQLGAVETFNFTAIAAGWEHTCALVGANRPKCWGSDRYGQLGIGTVLQRTTPVDVAGPSLTINYPNGQPGSFFTITGWNFPPAVQASLSINGQVISTTLGVNPTGSFIFFLNTSGAEPGGYTVTVSANPGATTSFRLANDAPLRSQEGGGQVFIVPNGIAFDNFIYLPLLRR
jgi:hypothetical protein